MASLSARPLPRHIVSVVESDDLPYMAQERLENLKSCFKTVDVDCTGYVPTYAVRAALKGAGLSAQAMQKAARFTNNGRFDWVSYTQEVQSEADSFFARRPTSARARMSASTISYAGAVHSRNLPTLLVEPSPYTASWEERPLTASPRSPRPTTAALSPRSTMSRMSPRRTGQALTPLSAAPSPALKPALAKQLTSSFTPGGNGFVKVPALQTKPKARPGTAFDARAAAANVELRDNAVHAVNTRFRLMKDAFRFIDKDGNGVLCHEEIKRALRMWNIPVKEDGLVSLMLKCDKNGYAELHDCAAHMHTAPYTERPVCGRRTLCRGRVRLV